MKEAQKRKKEGKEQNSGGNDINLQVLIKTHAASSGKKPPARSKGRRSSGGGGPSQDTRIKPRRVKVDETVEFKIVSVRSLNVVPETGAKRVVLSEAIMRTSGVPQPPLVEAREVTTPEAEERSEPICVQGVPAALRAYISKYFEGLRQIKRSP